MLLPYLSDTADLQQSLGIIAAIVVGYIFVSLAISALLGQLSLRVLKHPRASFKTAFIFGGILALIPTLYLAAFLFNRNYAFTGITICLILFIGVFCVLND